MDPVDTSIKNFISVILKYNIQYRRFLLINITVYNTIFIFLLFYSKMKSVLNDNGIARKARGIRVWQSVLPNPTNASFIAETLRWDL